MSEQIIIVVNSEKEKEYGQMLKNVISAIGSNYEATLWTTKHYTDNEPQLTSSQKIIFIGENDISKRNLSSITWQFQAPNMRYGWIGSVALITVGNTALSKEEHEQFKGMCKAQEQEIKSKKSPWVRILAAAGVFTFIFPLIGILAITGSVLMALNGKQKYLSEQRNQQYKYLINHFVLDDLNKYMGNEK